VTGSMRQQTNKELRIVAGRSSEAFAASVCAELGVELDKIDIENFANGEVHVRYAHSIRGCDAFIVGTHAEWAGGSINDAIVEHLVMVDAAKRASAKRITVVAPFYGYARQDRKASGREPISARLLADLFLAAGATRLLSVDLHSGQIQGFFNGPVDHLTAMPVLLEFLQSLHADDLVIVSPDAGRVKVAERYTNLLHADLAIVHKRRENSNEVSAKVIVGDVEGRTCVIVDDMIDTGGTIVAAADALAARGAATIYAATTHGVFSGPAIDRLKNSVIAKVVIANTLPLSPDKQIDKIEALSVASIIADAIDAVFEDTSVSEIFGGKNLS